ncbi:MAG: hypothetical protein U0840_15655 [Gemmataceae bacterium]
MTRILVRLTTLNLLTLLATFAVGWLSFLRHSRTSPDDPLYLLHIYLGLASATLTLGVHSLVFIYFLGTGRWVKEVCLAYQIPDHPLPFTTRELKRQAFPPALLAMLVPIVAAATGAGVATLQWPWYYHATMGLATLLVNAWAFAVEYRCVHTNAMVIDQVMVEVDRIRSDQGLVSNAEALRQADSE